MKQHDKFFLALATLSLTTQVLAVTTSDCVPEQKAYYQAVAEEAEPSYKERVYGGDTNDSYSIAYLINYTNGLDIPPASLLWRAEHQRRNSSLPRSNNTVHAFAPARPLLESCLYEARARELGDDSKSESTEPLASDGDKSESTEPLASDDGKKGGMRGAESATDDEIGKNQDKGGNPDWMYDDVDHDKCVSVKPSFQNSGSRMAYGHYKLINNCAYPIKVRTCITTDLMEDSSNYDLHQDGAKCPGMGWLMSELEANEVEEGREWFEYNRIKWNVQVCRKDWSFVGSDGESYPSNILGEEYGCRIRRQ